MNPEPLVTSQMLDNKSYPCTHFGKPKESNHLQHAERLVDNHFARCRTCNWPQEIGLLIQQSLNVEATSTLSHIQRKRIRVTEHSFQVHLLFAVRAHLLLSHNAPSSYAEFMEPGYEVKAWYSSE